MSIISKITGTFIKDIGDTVKKFVTTKGDKMDHAEMMAKIQSEIENKTRKFEIDVYEAEVKDRESARQLYRDDSWLQKIYALTFLIAYVLLTGLMVYVIYQISLGTNRVPEWGIAFMSTIFGAMSTKVSTITDFLFGGSKDKPKDEIPKIEK